MTENALLDGPPSRTLVLDGVLNFRDLGGYLTPTGAIVRWRQVFRSDALDGLTARYRAVLDAELGPFLAVDLRKLVEPVGSVPAARLRSTVHVPLLDGTAEADPLSVPGVPLEDVYLVLLRRCAERIALVLSVIAEAERPVVFHCGAGRDRTGLVAAVLLGVLGVSDDDISRGYALSAARRPWPGRPCRRRGPRASSSR